MSKLLQIWKNKSLIVEGLKNKLFKREDVEAVYQFRIGICEGCEHFNGHCAFPRTNPCCGSCGCSLEIKTRSMSAYCPEGLWEAVLTPVQEDILNETLAEQKS